MSCSAAWSASETTSLMLVFCSTVSPSWRIRAASVPACRTNSAASSASDSAPDKAESIFGTRSP